MSRVSYGAYPALNPLGFPDQYQKRNKEGEMVFAGLVPNTVNVEHLMREYGFTLRYDEMRRQRECTFPGAAWQADNRGDREINFVHDLCLRSGLRVSERKIKSALDAVAEYSAYHPVREWVESKPWDGTTRLQALMDTLIVESSLKGYRNRIVRRWLISAIAAVYSQHNSNAKFEGCLVLQGAQGRGKTSWFRALCSVPNAMLEGHKLDPENKDNLTIAVQHWLVELGELDTTFSKAELGSLKAFLSKTIDKARKPYGLEASELKRQTVFGATVNRSDYLIDDTGNRRWWTVPVLDVDYQHSIDMQQVWAEVKALFEQGEQWWLTQDEMAEVNTVNGAHQATSALDEIVARAFRPAEVGGQTLALVGMEPAAAPKADHSVWKLSATDVCQMFNLPTDKARKNEAAAALRRLTGQEPRSYGGARMWTVRPLFDSQYSEELRAWQEYRILPQLKSKAA